MSAEPIQPIEITDAFTIEGLDTLFSEPFPDEVDESAFANVHVTQETEAEDEPSTAITVTEVNQESSDSNNALGVPDDAKVSRTELVKILEGFVNLIRVGESDLPPGTQLTTGPMVQAPTQITPTPIVDRSAEVDELKGLLVEAQSTIITLLTDRVEDRARIATLETQINLLPDLQAQADRAMAVAINTDDIRDELEKVKTEIGQARANGVQPRPELLRTMPKGWWQSVKEWVTHRDTSVP